MAEGLASIQLGMTSTEAISLVGSPDQTRSFASEVARYDRWTRPSPKAAVLRIWAFGTSSRDSLPSLGQIWFNNAGLVSRVYGNEAVSQDVELFQEGELRCVLDVIDHSPALYGSTFDPKVLISLINRLLPLGKAKILAAVGEYLRVAPIAFCLNHSYAGLAVVLRLLFGRASGSAENFPENAGVPGQFRAVASAAFPYFPVILSHDVPYLLASDDSLAGSISLRDELTQARCGELRTRPLVPVPRPLESLDGLWAILASQQILFEEDLTQASIYRMIVNQFIRLIEDIHPIGDIPDQLVYGISVTMIADLIRRNIGHVPTRWDQDRCRFQLADSQR